jgi:hypothetical protein
MQLPARDEVATDGRETYLFARVEGGSTPRTVQLLDCGAELAELALLFATREGRCGDHRSRARGDSAGVAQFHENYAGALAVTPPYKETSTMPTGDVGGVGPFWFGRWLAESRWGPTTRGWIPTTEIAVRRCTRTLAGNLLSR